MKRAFKSQGHSAALMQDNSGLKSQLILFFWVWPNPWRHGCSTSERRVEGAPVPNQCLYVRWQGWTGVRPFVRVVTFSVHCAITLETVAWDWWNQEDDGGRLAAFHSIWRLPLVVVESWVLAACLLKASGPCFLFPSWKPEGFTVCMLKTWLPRGALVNAKSSRGTQLANASVHSYPMLLYLCTCAHLCKFSHCKNRGAYFLVLIIPPTVGSEMMFL